MSVSQSVFGKLIGLILLVSGYPLKSKHLVLDVSASSQSACLFYVCLPLVGISKIFALCAETLSRKILGSPPEVESRSLVQSAAKVLARDMVLAELLPRAPGQTSAESSECSSTLIQMLTQSSKVSWRALGKYFGAIGSFPRKRIQGLTYDNRDVS